jgi:hypothetical protein
MFFTQIIQTETASFLSLSGRGKVRVELTKQIFHGSRK